MSAVEALKAARAAGLELTLDGGDLALRAASAPPAGLLDALSRHKAEIIALLRPGRDGWSREDWQVYFDERAGMIEFDGGLPREMAELQAIGSCVLDPHMAETSPEVLNQFIRSLPAHIGRSRPPPVSDENEDAPGGTADERATP